MFSLSGKVTIITGGSGVLGGSLAKHLLQQNAIVIIIGRTADKVKQKEAELQKISNNVKGYVCDVMDIHALQDISQQIISDYSKIDILINAAGGNTPGATVTPDKNVFDLDQQQFDLSLALNLHGSVYPTMVFGKEMAKLGKGSIINISSMAAISAITRVPAYSIAKTGIDMFTKWMATELALKFGDKIRVNAIAPGFFIGDQNRKLLLNDDGSLTERSEKVIAKTPMGRFGNIDELNGAVQFLCSEAASFVTGIVLPVDGGFSAFSGV